MAIDKTRRNLEQERSSKTLLERLRHPPEWFDRTLHILGILVVSLEIVKGGLELKLAVLLKIIVVLAGVTFWVLAFWVYTARVRSTADRSITIHRHHRKTRRLALTMMILIVTIFGGLYLAKFVPTQDFIVLVADFNGPEPERYRVTEILLHELRQASKEEHTLRVEALGEQITERQGTAEARNRGGDRKASLIFWGWYGVTSEGALITANVEMLKHPRFMSLNNQGESFNVAASELNQFKTQFKLAHQINYLTFMIRGVEEFEQGDLDEAISEFTKAITAGSAPDQMISPDAIYHLRGVCHYYKGDLDNSLADYDKALALNPKSADVLNDRGIIVFMKGNWAEAGADFERAIKINPNLVYAYCNRGEVAVKAARFADAKADFKHAMDLRPAYAPPYNLRGAMYGDLRDFDHALADFKKAIDLDRDYAVPHNNLGFLYARERQDYDRAIDEYDEALALNPRYKEALNNRGVAYLLKGDSVQAESNFRGAIQIDPKYFDAHRNLGIAYRRAANYHEAVAEFKVAAGLTTDPLAQADLKFRLEELEGW